MTCKNCLGDMFCSKHDKKRRVDKYCADADEVCKHFKDKSCFIELPCKVGDTVYVLEYEDDCAVDYSGCIFIMANNDFAFLSPIINGERNPIEICNVFFDRYINFDNNSGIIVPLNELYLTKEEAESKLKELNGDG